MLLPPNTHEEFPYPCMVNEEEQQGKHRVQFEQKFYFAFSKTFKMLSVDSVTFRNSAQIISPGPNSVMTVPSI